MIINHDNYNIYLIFLLDYVNILLANYYVAINEST